MPDLKSHDDDLEVDAATLTREEWFFLWVAFGQKPDASLRDIHEYRTRTLGMPRAEQQTIMLVGMEKLKERGVIVQERDREGKLVFDKATGQPVWVGRGRVVTRVEHSGPPIIT